MHDISDATSPESLATALARGGWQAERYAALHPDLKGHAGEDLATHYLAFGHAEGRKYSDARAPAVHLERLVHADGLVLVYGWAERAAQHVGVIVRDARGASSVPCASLTFWRDDVASHLSVPAKTVKHGFVIVCNAGRFDMDHASLVVCCSGGFIGQFDGARQKVSGIEQALLDAYRLLESLHTYDELLALLHTHRDFLQSLSSWHRLAMDRVAVSQSFASEPAASRSAYAICAVALGNASLVKNWLMALGDRHDLAQCEVRLLCNGPLDFDRIAAAARWFAANGGRIALFYAERNIGFNNAVNHLVAGSRAPYTMVTNLDVDYLSFDLPRLAAECATPCICISRQFNAHGAVQHLGLDMQPGRVVVHGAVIPTLETRLVGRNTFLERRAAPFRREVEFFGAACIFGPTKLLAELGPFSRDYLYAYHEDSELALRARGRGVRLVVTDAMDLVHYESSGAQVDLPKTFLIAANTVMFMGALAARGPAAAVASRVLEGGEATCA